MHERFIDRTIEMVVSELRPSHDPDFRVDFPDGYFEYGFVYFHEAVVLEDESGRLARPAGTGIVFLPRQPRFYYAIKGSLQHTWFLATGPGIEWCLETYKIPTFQALELNDLPFLAPFIAEARQEGVVLQEHSEDAVTDLFHDFFRKIGVVLAETSEALTPAQRSKARMRNAVRVAVHSDLARAWTVRDMAKLAGLNPTRFAMEYRLQFGISPIDDLIDARLKRAEYMLRHATYPIKQIARECGFNSEAYFSRTFRDRRGCSPGQFRNDN